MKKFFLFCVLAQLILSVGQASAASGFVMPEMDEVLSRLDENVRRMSYYHNLRVRSADSLRNVMEHCDEDELLDKYLELGTINDGLSTQSAISAYTDGLNLSDALKDTVMVQRFIVRRAYQYYNAGDVSAAIHDLNHVRTAGVRPENAALFYCMGARIYVALGALYKNHSIDHDPSETGLSYARKWASLTEPGSVDNRFANILIFFCEGKQQRMAQAIRELLDSIDESHPAYPNACSLLGEYYNDRGDIRNAIIAYAVSANSNMRYSRPDGVSLFRLGELLYEEGDYSRAHAYLDAALRQSVGANERFNLMRINSAYLNVMEDMNRQKYQKFFLLAALSLLMLVLVVVVLFMMRSKRREVECLRLTQKRLARTNLAMETYITKFMTLSSDYIEGLEEYNRVCARKIKAGQTDDLLAFIKSGKALDEAHRKFYAVFDSALFHLFPSFVEDVNRLLQPEKQIVPPGPGVLTTELRVAALTRLGIEDASVIARCLGISTNTIYTYRNKLRTRAIDRAVFEEELKKIGAPETLDLATNT